MVAWLTVSPSARVQASDADDLMQAYPYWVWYPDTNQLALCTVAPKYYNLNDSNYPTISNPNTNASVEIGARYYYYLGSAKTNDMVILRYYPDLDIWQAEIPWTVSNNNICVGYQSTYAWGEIDNPKQIYTNGFTPAVGSAGSGANRAWTLSTSLPASMPAVNIGLPDINAMINDALNASTSVTTDAITINNNINNTYNNYISGSISQAEYNTAMNSYRTQLETLANTPNTTLVDQIAINNALTNLDVKVNQQVNNASPDLVTLVEQFRYDTSVDYNNYTNGIRTQEDTLTRIKQRVVYFIRDTLSYTSTADRALIDNALNMSDQIVSSITNYSDLDKDVAESAIQSDAEEVELLNDMVSQMQEMETDSIMQNQQVQQNLTEVSNWLEPLWDNIFIVGLIGTTALLVPIAVLLDMRYKGL